MELSILIAKLIAVVSLFLGLGILINIAYYKKIFSAFLDNKSALFFNGIIATMIGLLMVTYHNIWEGEWWVIIITLFGWAGLLKGFLLLVLPRVFDSFKSMYKSASYWKFQSVALIILGLVFGYFGFFS